jgi:hypothetical protein
MSEMKLTAEEMAQIQEYRSRINSLLAEVGSLEMRKAQTLDLVNQNDKLASEYVRNVRARLGIAENARMEISPEGNVTVTE